MCRNPGVLTYDWTKNGGQVKTNSACPYFQLTYPAQLAKPGSDSRALGVKILAALFATGLILRCRMLKDCSGYCIRW
jgi:hypothetical protein